MAGEHVILLDEHDKPSGILEKYAAHTLSTPLHLAFSCWLFNERGQLLVTRRSLSKVAWPGVWTNSVCGHPQQGETFEQAIIRRCRFEVGVDIADITAVATEFRYRAVAPNGIVENEVCPVFAARVTSPVQANHDEVIEYQWGELDAIFEALKLTPWAFSPWMVMEAADDNARQALIAFAGR
ncbi:MULTISPECIES: isopentenyl-diphosphate Delta-isomerase [Enterobacteriaceae]|uniref:Isopentenyl-diphosphate Delta-isomerase n=1 Tax=Kluyvera genomosp. 2 TaxID=2774054 RepID=A0A2T2Y3M0_9ENTR|nr:MULTISPECIES: isopentenyl-diphosphate Delta-isomerase [Enterobacteriaceae]HAT3918073.1 isopentenyl-diphosphate Delta-isomerase [Kluyvera ascorbata]PSR47136.1 isopentenyl-diphosphate Delta-isomerase [Kluyvera genomosp. 2]BBQ82326.1 isopentenyl-diphosphate Delta-isomerase [Klebsiella sp. WP3-W18-ESBL-02]BBR19407.1 isopentenyl-diphosphate Delta-isomerase [Klebsiella sp. WP3-S18-ESBL-05]BBR57549.1 isopentenyl-diphosphate Delta-isomerase [Klebsiella sp. WP4-W18-ESBL-05]